MQTLRQSCSATVLDGDDIVYVVRLSAHRTMSINLGIGSRLPAYCTSMGRVLLSGLAPEALRERLSKMALLKITPATKVDIEVLMEEIAQVRRQGWCLVQEELEQGLIALAAPVFDRPARWWRRSMSAARRRGRPWRICWNTACRNCSIRPAGQRPGAGAAVIIS